ncbi:MAG TPA: hypothetical protein VJB87_02215 [Candidatus Nanoarchaeia archaeon]|nr:hypothetical protein [Candidatus Nanoarchaeia archaeon]
MKTTTRYITTLAITFFFFIISYALLQKDGHYIFDSTKFIIITLILYKYYDHLRLNHFSHLGIISAMVLHSLGRFGAFNWTIIFPWDVITHFVASYFITLLLYQALPQLQTKKGLLIILLASIGIATIGEFIEFGGAIHSPNGQGILGVESKGSPIPWLSPDYWDTMKDLVINTLGSIICIITLFFTQKNRKLLFS